MVKLKNLFMGMGGLTLLQVTPPDNSHTEDLIKTVFSALVAIITGFFQWKHYKKSKQ